MTSRMHITHSYKYSAFGRGYF